MFNKRSWTYFLIKTVICALFSSPIYVLGDWLEEDYYDIVVFKNGMRIPLPIVCDWKKEPAISNFDRFQRKLLKQTSKSVSSLPRFDSIYEAEDKTLVPCYLSLHGK